MLILSPLREGHHQLCKDEKQLVGDEVESFGFNGGNNAVVDFPEFSGGMGNLLDSIDFDDLFIGIHDGDVLPDLEMDSEMLDFSVSTDVTGRSAHQHEEYYNNNTNTTSSKVEDREEDQNDDQKVAAAAAAAAVSITSTNTSGLNQNYSSSSTTTTLPDLGDQETVSKGDDVSEIRAAHHQVVKNSSTTKESTDQKLALKLSSSTAQSKNSHGKRKVKVDWTPELHRRFVQAVEQLGVDKAVPSRILELMGIDCLTRHNIASHLQKYRSHRKHLLAREAEAASWTQRRQMYSGGAKGGGGGGKTRSDVVMMMNNSPNWLNAPIMGFPPATSTTPMHHAHPHHHHQLVRPLHVWGHPSMDQSMMMWPKHLPPNFQSPVPPPPPQPPAHAWPPPPPPLDATYWHHPHPHPNHQRAPNALTSGRPFFPRQLPTTTRFAAPPVPGIPPHAMYKVDPGVGTAPTAQQSGPHHPRALLDFYPSKESIDAAIGDVLSKPWLPLPLGLRPPATDTVMVELQRQGIPKIPPSCA